MNRRQTTDRSRRDFLVKGVAVAGALSFFPSLLTHITGTPAGYRALRSDEARFTEALVNAMCPPDRLTPNGVSCGLAFFMDAHLAGEFGAESSLHAASKREFYGQGVAALDAASRQRFGRPFSQLTDREAGILLADAAAGRVASPVPLATWYREVVDPLLVQASFSGPVYDRYDNNVFQKIFG
jgi:gluconate 2-dehydrogenase gamma chain